MAGTWKTIALPSTVASGSAFAADMMLLLTDGSLLVHNAYGKEWLRFQPDPTSGYSGSSWSSVYQESDMANTRQYFASGILRDGRVFAIGGEDSDAGSDTPVGEVFDPQTNAWTKVNKPSAFDFARGDCNGSVLADGRVLIGGASTTVSPSTWSKLTAIWDPTDDSWVQAGLEFGVVASTTKEDPFEEESFALLPDGSILAPAVRDTPKAQRYVPSLDRWVDCTASPVNLAITTLNAVGVYETAPVMVLPNGTAFAIGGTGQTALFTPGPNSTDPGSWTQGPTFPKDTSASPNWPTLTSLDAPACLLPNGQVVCLGGTTTPDSGDYFSLNTVFLIYDPNSIATTLLQLDAQPTLPAGNWTWQCNFMLLPTGQLLCSVHTNALFLYTPDPSTSAPNAAWKPGNISVPATMVLGHSYTLSGTQINGLSQAVSYGDDGGMATNYPIVQLTSPGTGQVIYLRSYDFSTMGVAKGTMVPDDLQSCSIDIPPDLATGNWNLAVIANGISSESVSIQIAAQDCFFIVDNSTFSVGEIDTYVKGTPPANAVFNPAFYVVVEGYTAAEIGVNLGNLMNPPNVPVITPLPAFPGHLEIAFAGPVIPEDPTLPAGPQRFTFPFSITFLDDSMFGASAFPVTLAANFLAAGSSVSSSATITLSPNPNPFILHGDQTLNPPEPWYLSQDLKVFQVIAAPGNTVFGAGIGTGSAEQVATTYIQAAVTNLRNNTGTTRADFDAINQDEGSEVLQLLPNDPNSGHAVYNFAIARVRLRDTMTASNVRVFFRIWQAQQTNAAYNNTTYPRGINSEGQPIPVLGVQGDEIMTIPFFAQARVATNQQLHLQEDDLNRSDIDTSSGETDFFFGCWLDVNQPSDLRYPQRVVGVSADGPFNVVSPLFPIQQFMVAAHQCLIAEIAYDPDPIPVGSDPSNSDKLAQRNLAFVGAPNPGNPASRRVPQTFEVKPTPPKLREGAKPDELMIEWNSVPVGSFAEVYLPAVSADAILATASALYTSHLLKREDVHTLRFPAAGMTYIPIPQGEGVSFAGLLTLDLPAGIHKGESYTAIVRQVTSVSSEKAVNVSVKGLTPNRKEDDVRHWRRTTGTFKLTIPVSTKAALLEPEERYLSVMKWVGEAIPTTSRWYLVMQRYLNQISARVIFMGGNPTQIQPSGKGIWKAPFPGPFPHSEHRFVGKVETLIYDRFGDFEGFTLETMSGEINRFESREPRIGDLARRAWQERSRVLVVVEGDHSRRPSSIILSV